MAVGDPVTGVLKLTSGDYKDTHLGAWRPSSFQEWKAASPESFFDLGVELPTDGIYKLPSLGFKHMPSNRGFTSKLLFIPDKSRASVEMAALPLPKPLVPRVNGLHPEPAPPAPPVEPKPQPPTKASMGDLHTLFSSFM